MPFEPLSPEEQKAFAPPCRHPEHNPPSHMVFYTPGNWVCPACGASVVLRPPFVQMTTGWEARTVTSEPLFPVPQAYRLH